MLTNNSKLAKVSSSPGKTTLINHFLINGGQRDEEGWYLVDLPGYGYAKRSQSQRKEWESMIANYFQQRENLVSVFVLIDSRIPPQKNDMEFIQQLASWGTPFNLIFTKTDKEKQAVVSRNVSSFVAEMKKSFQFIPARFMTSAQKGTGRNKVLEFIGELNEQFT